MPPYQQHLELFEEEWDEFEENDSLLVIDTEAEDDVEDEQEQQQHEPSRKRKRSRELRHSTERHIGEGRTGSRPSREQKTDHSPADDIANRVIDALLPRLDARLNEMATGVAMKMLEAIGGRLNKLESKMDDMQREWRDALQANDDDDDDHYDNDNNEDDGYDDNNHNRDNGQHRPRGLAQNSPLPSPQAKQRIGYRRHRIAQDSRHGVQFASTAAPTFTPLRDLYLGTAQVVHDSTPPEHEAQPGNLPFPANRRRPYAVRRDRLQPAPEYQEPNAQYLHLEGREMARTGLNGEQPFVANTGPPAYVPQHYKLNRFVTSVVGLWKEFFIGGAEKPAINELDRRYGSAWRLKSPSECVYYGLRRTIIDELANRVEKRGIDLGATGEEAAQVWHQVAEEMDNERKSSHASLNQYSQELKRRDRLRSPPPPAPTVCDTINGPLPLPEPVLSRTTSTVAELWKEWFDGKEDYMGHEKFPSITAINLRWGDAWRRRKTPEYPVYLSAAASSTLPCDAWSTEEETATPRRRKSCRRWTRNGCAWACRLHSTASGPGSYTNTTPPTVTVCPWNLSRQAESSPRVSNSVSICNCSA